MASKKASLVLSLPGPKVLDLAVEGEVLVVASQDGAVRRVREKEPGAVRTWPLEATRPTAVAVSPDGATVVVGGEDGVVRGFREPEEPEGPRFYRGHAGAVRAVAISPDGKLVVSGGDDGTVRVFDAATTTELRRTRAREVRAGGERAPASTVGAVAFSGDGLTIVARSPSTVQLLHFGTLEERAAFAGPAAAFVHTSDGKTVASPAEPGKILVMAPGRNVFALEGKGLERPIAFSPSGELLLARGRGGALHLFSITGRAELAKLEESRGADKVAFSRDGRRIAAVTRADGADDVVRLWAISG